MHCESTAIGDLLAFDGLHLSEPMVFGLGIGLGSIYWDMKKMPFPFVGGRIKPDELMDTIRMNRSLRLTDMSTKDTKKGM